MAHTKIVIVGGGVAGTATARRLIRVDDKFELSLTLVDPETHHRSMYLSDDLCLPLARLLSPDRVNLRHSSVAHWDINSQLLTLKDNSTLAYDQLVVTDERPALLPPITRPYPNLFLGNTFSGRRDFLDQLNWISGQLAEDPQQKLSILIVGSGRTGSRAAAQLARWRTAAIQRRLFKKNQVIVKMFEAALRVAPHETDFFRQPLKRILDRDGVEVFLGRRIEAHHLTDWALVSDPHKQSLIFWAAGRTGSSLFNSHLAHYQTPRGQLTITGYFRLPGRDQVWVAGDMAASVDGSSLAVAERQGIFVADNLRRVLNHQPLISYESDAPRHGWPALSHYTYLARLLFTWPTAPFLWGSKRCWSCRRRYDQVKDEPRFVPRLSFG